MRILAAVVVVAIFAVPMAALAGPSIAGDFQGWNPADPAYDLTLAANGVYTLTKSMVAGSYAYKAIDGDAWGQDFPGSNQLFTLAGDQDVTWYVNLGAVVGTKQGDEYVFHSMNPPIVCGDFMSELGGTDWDQTDTSLTVMDDTDGDGIWEWQSVIPAGNYEFKIVLNNNWDQNTSPSGNKSFTSDGSSSVLFRYHMQNNLTEVFSSAPPVVVSARVPAACPMDPGLIEVKFSKDMEETSAETSTNYTVSGGHMVTTATRDGSDFSIVVLEVTPDLSEGNDYQVTVTGVTDTDATPIDPLHNDACFYLYKVVFEVNMDLYIADNGAPTSVNLQGDTYPLNWDTCAGCEAYDDGTNGGDAAAGDSTYTATEYFSMQYACGGQADTTTVKYKYLVDCVTWEGDYDFGHYVTLDPAMSGQTMNVWWNDVSPVDNTTCDVGVRFQVYNAPACGAGLFVRGTELPLDWSTGVELLDDGTGGDVVSGDGVYSALVTFPTGTYKYLEYKYFCADSDTSGVYECDTYPNRTLTLDDVNGCMALRAGPMEVQDLWNWCSPIVKTPEGRQAETSWGKIKSLYR
jgi:hypothetical protein